jgi:hypothetical protein
MDTFVGRRRSISQQRDNDDEEEDDDEEEGDDATDDAPHPLGPSLLVGTIRNRLHLQR